MIRLTLQTRMVLAYLADGQPHHGGQIAADTGLSVNTVYSIVRRLGDCGWLDLRVESDPPVERPARHYWTLTDAGRQANPPGSGRNS